MLIIILVNRHKGPSGAVIINDLVQPKIGFENNIKILSWNIGYGGHGKESEFIMDGGKKLLPPSRSIVRKNINAIIDYLTGQKCDIYLLQEVSKKSLLSRNIDILAKIREKFSKYFLLFRPDIASILVPYPLKILHGTLTIAKIKPNKTAIKTLPFDPVPLAGIFNRHYALQINYFDILGKEEKWVIVNLHLAAFDKEGLVRKRQLKMVFDFAQKEYAKGNYVILGGDWNIELVKTNFAHQTDIKYLSWRVPLAKNLLPKKWKLAVDETKPTVRTLNKPYVRGENYTSIIDGFIISPNVEVCNIITDDLNFEFSDHQPILGEFVAK